MESLGSYPFDFDTSFSRGVFVSLAWYYFLDEIVMQNMSRNLLFKSVGIIRAPLQLILASSLQSNI